MKQGRAKIRREERVRLSQRLRLACSRQDTRIVLWELSDAEVHAMMLRFLERKTIGEIAREMNISISKASKFCNRALYLLRQKFASEYFDQIKIILNKKKDIGANY
jgi:DNA-directed RNA polymerase specialized sigma24 family protein